MSLAPIVPPRAFLGALRRLLRGLLSGADLAEHVDDDEVGEDPAADSLPSLPA